MEALMVSFGIVAANEMGDKTQILALCLLSRFQRPWPVMLGIFAATLTSNLVAGLLGHWIGGALTGRVLHLALGVSFLAAAVWALLPEKEEPCPDLPHARGIFLASFTSFLLAEMGDKTQLAAIVLAARFHPLAGVIAGTTLGMMAANLPVLMLGQAVMKKVPLGLVRSFSGAVFGVLGLYELSEL